MAEYFYSVARVDHPTKGAEFGWQVIRHDGKRTTPVSGIFLTSEEAVRTAARFDAEQIDTDG